MKFTKSVNFFAINLQPGNGILVANESHNHRSPINNDVPPPLNLLTIGTWSQRTGCMSTSSETLLQSHENGSRGHAIVDDTPVVRCAAQELLLQVQLLQDRHVAQGDEPHERTSRTTHPPEPTLQKPYLNLDQGQIQTKNISHTQTLLVQIQCSFMNRYMCSQIHNKLSSTTMNIQSLFV